MFYTEKEKHAIVDEYNRKRRKVKILRLRLLLVFALCLPFVPKRLMYTKAGKTMLLCIAVAFGLASAAVQRSVMACPLCGMRYGMFYKRPPNVCPHCGEYLGPESYTGK